MTKVSTRSGKDRVADCGCDRGGRWLAKPNRHFRVWPPTRTELWLCRKSSPRPASSSKKPKDLGPSWSPNPQAAFLAGMLPARHADYQAATGVLESNIFRELSEFTKQVGVSGTRGRA